jgi:hypothetical protein
MKTLSTLATTLAVLAAAPALATADDAAPTPAAAPTPPLQVFNGFDFRHNHVVWGAALGDQGLTSDQFLRLVGRDDLADSVHRHRTIALVAGIGAMAAMTVMSYEIAQENRVPNIGMCFGVLNSDGCLATAQSSQTQSNQTHQLPAVLAGGAGVAMVGLAMYELITAPRLSADDAAALAAHYNATHVAPYATPDGAGFSVQGTF